MQPTLRGAAVDRITQRWVIASGRPVSFGDEHRWLDGPVGSPDGVGERWIGEHAARLGADVREPDDAGVLPDLRILEGPGFRADELHPSVRDFYEHTARWRLDVWSRWSRWAEPGGRVLNTVFAHRLRQLALPLDPLDVAYGLDSRLLAFRSPTGEHLGAAWQRTLRSTGATVFGGFYGTAALPGQRRRSIRVVFPLPNGSLTVFLRPGVRPDGSLRLVSPRGRFGEEGAYLVVRPDGADEGWSRRVPLPERFDVFVDRDDQLRCDHQLHLGRAEVLHLHYRMAPSEVDPTST